MTDILMEAGLCLVIAIFLMVSHETVKVLVYRILNRKKSSLRVSPWKFWRYIDPVGLILAVVSYVPISKPYFFRIREKRTNLLLGITGLVFLVAVFTGSVLVLRFSYGGMKGLDHMVVTRFWDKLLSAFWQYLAMLSFGMLVANLFPVSTFDMGLVLAGYSSKIYLNIIKSDGTIKMILILALLLDIIRYIDVRLLLWIL